MNLAFEWSADTGTIEPPWGSRTVTYHAPIMVGSATISLAVKNADNDTTVDIKTHLLQVVLEPTTIDVIANFAYDGWMGDAEIHGKGAITLDDTWLENPHSPPACIKISYRPGPAGWAGLYFLTREDNWGGYSGLDLTGYTKLSWYAKGETGNEVVLFKAGGIDVSGKKYRDSFGSSLGNVKLEKEWARYEMDLSNKDLSSVIGGFAFAVTKIGNPNGLTFYIDSITYE